MFLEIHALQSFPPSNLNRDDTGSPKDCEFGGVRRARVSSQCWKRSIRMSDAFKNRVTNIGIRTRRILDKLTPRVQEALSIEEQEAAILARLFLEELVGNIENERSAVLYYYSEPELAQMAALLQECWEEYEEELRRSIKRRLDPQNQEKAKNKEAEEEEKALRKVFKKLARDYKKKFAGKTASPDIALFGRMLASSPELNVDAAAQVAHAISTHRVAMDFDYFTAVDDLNPREDPGAGMIGLVGFNASCFYRYATIDVNQLQDNLVDTSEEDRNLSLDTIEAFLYGFVEARPSGKQNTFAAHTLPDAIMVVIRDRSQPLSLVNAFERPVRGGQDGYMAASVKQFVKEWKDMQTMYNYGDTEVFFCCKPSLAIEPPEGGSDLPDIKTLIGSVIRTLESKMNAIS